MTNWIPAIADNKNSGLHLYYSTVTILYGNVTGDRCGNKDKDSRALSENYSRKGWVCLKSLWKFLGAGDG